MPRAPKPGLPGNPEGPASYTILREKSFDRDMDKLPPEILRTAEAKIRRLAVTLEHPGLRLKKLCSKGHFRIKINAGHRIAFYLEGANITLLMAGTHREYENWIRTSC